MRIIILLLFVIFLLNHNACHAADEQAKKINCYIDELKNQRFHLFDHINYEYLEPNFQNIYKLIELNLGHQIINYPSINEINHDLFSLVDSLDKYMPNESYSLHSYKVGKSALQLKLKTTSFISRWKKIVDEENFNDDFYIDLYHALSSDETLDNGEFVDETDKYLNTSSDSLEIKRDYLIIFLASIKNPVNNTEISPEIKVRTSTKIQFPTSANSDSWFAEMRYKLYRIWQKLDLMGVDDRSTLLTNFLHAGKHCSVAKRWQIDDSYKLFNFTDFEAIERENRVYATSLVEKVALVLAKEKERVLLRHVDIRFEKELNISRNSVNGKFDYSHLNSESSTFKAATWDQYARFLGLEEKQCPYPSYALNLDEKNFFQAGSYNAARIIDVVTAELGEQILNENLGIFRYFVKDPSQFIVGFLSYHGFILDPNSALEVVETLEPKQSKHKANILSTICSYFMHPSSYLFQDEQHSQLLLDLEMEDFQQMGTIDGFWQTIND